MILTREEEGPSVRSDDPVGDHLVLGGLHDEDLEAQFGTCLCLPGVQLDLRDGGDVPLTVPESGSSEMRG